jgi:GT2 family glycosyltransferase
MSINKLATVIILNFNNYHFTIECLKSLTYQTYPNFDIVVIDNGSERELYAELKKELNSFESTLNIKLIRNECNLYFSAGNNKAIKAAKGDYICLLNYDTIVMPDFIEKMVNFLEKTPDAGMITPKIKVYKDKSILWNAGAYLNFKSGIVIGNRGYLEYDPNDQKYNQIEEIGFAPGTAVFFRREIIEKVGLMDEIFFMYHEDPDWNLRAQKVGYKSYYVPTTIVYHNVSRVGDKKREFFNYHFFTRNSQIVVWKHATIFNLIIYYTIFSIMNFGLIILYIIGRNFRNAFLQLNSMWQGLRIGIRRRTNRSCGTYMRKDFHFIDKL